MQLISFQNLPLYQFDTFSGISSIQHFVSTRKGGISQGNCSSLNLGYNTQDTPEKVSKNREIIAKAMGVSNIIFPQQTHKNHVQLVTHNTISNDFADTDALITNQKGICIAVIFADCVPILVFDPVNQVIGAIHAGWRGTVAKIIEKTIEKMQHEFGTNPSDIIAGIGPSISPQAYEVGNEVIEKVEAAFPSINLVSNRTTEKGYLNLWEANKQSLLNTGVLEKNIEIAGLCTKENHDTFFSVRHEKETGRFATGIMLK